MAEARIFNVVRFKTAPVKLEGAFTMKAGLEPDVNSFLVAYDDFETMLATADAPGDLEFYSTRLSGAAGTGTPTAAAGTYDHRIEQLSMVHWEPVEWGAAIGASDVGKPLVWRVYVADFRQRLAKPRGGRLTQKGVLNGKGDKTLYSMTQLITYCLTRMALGSAVPAEVDDVPPPRDLQWFGTHAPTQLDELLDRAGAVFVPTSTAQSQIVMMGSGDAPAAPGTQALPTAKTGKDRRGKTIVFTSAPNQWVERLRLDGPSAAGADKPTFTYVAPDPNDFGRWKPLSEITALGSDPLKTFQGSFESVDPAFQKLLSARVYRCIRLDPKTYGTTPFLKLCRKWHLEGSGNTRHGVVDDLPIRVTAKMATILGNLTWKNATVKLHIEPSELRDGAILCFPDLLMKLDTAEAVTPPLPKRLIPLDPTDMTIEFGRERKTADGDPIYFTIGYQKDDAGTGLTELSAEDTEAVMASADEDVIVIERPEWIAYRENNEDINLADLKKGAKAEATRLLAGSDDPAEVRSGVGFFPIELSGRVSEIKITQTPPKTEWKVNCWWLPGEARLERLRRKEKNEDGSGGTRQGQAVEADRRTTGASGSVDPVVMMATPPAPIPAGPAVSMVQVTGHETGGWYRGRVLVRPMATFTAGSPLGAITDASTATPTQILIANGLEVSRNDPEIRLKLEGFYVGVEGEPQADGTRTFFITHDPDTIKNIRFDTTAHADGSKWIQVSYSVAGGLRGAWVDKIEVRPCDTGGGS